MIEIIVYIICVLLSIFAVSGINFNNFFKKNHIWEARVFIVIISFVMGYLLAEFIINFTNLSIIK